MTKASELKLLTKIIAATKSAKISEADLDFLPSGLKLMHIANNTECGAYKHHALAILNENDKEIIISNYGTHLNFNDLTTTTQDLFADLQLALKIIPNKFSSTIAFIEQIKELLGEEYQDYKITCTGHSLGGFLAQLGGTFCKAIGFQDVKIVAFDSPGAREVTEKLAQHLNFSGDLNENIENYYTRPNLVNSTNKYLGKIFYVPKLEQQLDNEANNGFINCLTKLTGINNIIEQVDDHMIWNFTNGFELIEANNPNEQLLEVQNHFIILDNNEIYNEAKKLYPNAFEFDRNKNGTNPEYLTYNSNTELGWEYLNLEDHDNITGFYNQNFCSSDITQDWSLVGGYYNCEAEVI
jgi:hypothetical protein